MRKSVALVVAVLLGTPTGTLAQGLAETTRLHGPLLTAALAEATRLGGSSSSVAASQSSPAPDGWDQLQSLRVGTRIRVTLTDGTEIEGQLVQATPDAVVLTGNRLLKGQFTTPAGASIRDQRTFLRSDLAGVQAETRLLSTKGAIAVIVAAGIGGIILTKALVECWGCQ